MFSPSSNSCNCEWILHGMPSMRLVRVKSLTSQHATKPHAKASIHDLGKAWRIAPAFLSAGRNSRQSATFVLTGKTSGTEQT